MAEAGDGREAVALARHHRPDVVVLDLAMPGIGGLEALTLIQAVAPEARVVIFSGLDPACFAPVALRQGAVAYFAKGRDPRELVPALRDLATDGRVGPGMMNWAGASGGAARRAGARPGG